MRTRWIGAGALISVIAAAAACDTGTAPADEGVPESQLTFLRFPPDLQPLVTPTDSFYAVAGENRELVLYYQLTEADEEREEFLEFRVPGNGLLRRPDGSVFERGDSILIKVTVSEDARFLFRFEPAGLVFHPDHPARLEVSYERVGGDLDGDGDVDEEDDELEREMRVWRQEAPGALWYPVGTLKLEDFDEIEGEINGFTRFAIAG